MNVGRIVGGLAIVAVIAGLGGCGGGSAPPRSSAPATAASGLSRNELAARASAICAAAKAETRSIPTPGNIGSDAIAAAGYFDRVSPIADRAAKTLRALTPAPEAASGWQAFLAAELATDELLRTLKQKADAKDPSGIAYLYREPAVNRRFSEEAGRFGAAGCR